MQVSWYRDTLKLDTNERRITEVRGSRHTLIVRKVQASDFGNYSCVADNVVGKSRSYVELSGKYKYIRTLCVYARIYETQFDFNPTYRQSGIVG